VGEIRERGGQAVAVSGDVTVSRDVAAIMAQAGALDILINNAGGIPTELYDANGAVGIAGPLWELADENWDRVIATNLRSVFLCTKAALPQMIARGRGDVVTIASRMGRVVGTLGGPYAAAKTAVITLTQLFAVEAQKHGVRVNAVSPGLIDTPGQRRLMTALLPPNTPLPPTETAESVAQAVLYILCDAPRTMTGQSLDTFWVG
jgi:3-oxoacyl-[acyl-carrier protein] reductase